MKSSKVEATLSKGRWEESDGRLDYCGSNVEYRWCQNRSEPGSETLTCGMS